MKDIRFAKFVLIINALVPGTLLAWDAWHGKAGANPVNYAILTTGLLGLIFLTLTLLVTPLRKITGINWLFNFRKNLGLFAFFYVLAHFLIYFFKQQSGNIRDALNEILQANYLIVGSIGLLVMVPLAMTSFNRAIKKMGPKKWKALHCLTYLAAAMGALHYCMEGKVYTPKQIIFAGIITLLLLYRGYELIAWLLDKKSPRPIPLTAGPKQWTGSLRVQKIIQETHDVRTFRFVPEQGTSLPFVYQPGQYLTLSLLIDGKTVRRSYTIASTPSRPGSCEVTIKRNPDGVSSVCMHDHVKEGQSITMSASSGKFIFTGENAKGVVLLAAGVGITPLMGMIRYLTDRAWPGDIHLLYSNKTEADVIFLRELEDLQSRFKNLHVTLTLTRNESKSWNHLTGRIDAALLARTVPDLVNLPIYICGPNEMLSATRELLVSLNVPKENIFTESFGSKPTALQPATTSTFEITFARSNKMTSIPANRTILECAEDNRIPADFECRSGICGTCKCKLLSGSVLMDMQEALNDTDRENNIILLCQAKATEDVSVEL